MQYHDNNVLKKMCIKNLSYGTETYLRYNVKREKQVEKYMWALYHELVIFLKSSNRFRYVPENKIEGGILGWTLLSNPQRSIQIVPPPHKTYQISWRQNPPILHQ